jgi:Rho termination factor-like protein
MPSSVRRLTQLDHERLQRLLRRACIAGPGQERWRSEFVALLRAHRVAERDEVLPHLVGHDVLSDTARAQAEDDVALDRIAAEAAGISVGSGDHDDWCERSGRLVDEHSTRWAENLMQPLENLVPRAVVRSLGGSYERRREDELSSAGVPGDPPRRLDLSRAELYEMARKAGIEGRSSMTRGELIDELQRRQQSG